MLASSCERIYFAQILHYNGGPFIKHAQQEQFGNTSINIKLPCPCVNTDCQTPWLLLSAETCTHFTHNSAVPIIFKAVVVFAFGLVLILCFGKDIIIICFLRLGSPSTYVINFGVFIRDGPENSAELA